jgi:hypothetical protein
MKRKFAGTILLLLILAFPMATLAQVNVRIDIAFPPPIAFVGPPEVIVFPGTYIYAVPYVPEDIYFYNGWWWRLWNERWYRSRYYNSGWVYYDRVPAFYYKIPTGWREYYHEHHWEGRPWNYQLIPYEHLHRNWSGWQKSRYWEHQQNWGVQGYRTHPPSQNYRPAPPPQKPYREIKPQSEPYYEVKPYKGSERGMEPPPPYHPNRERQPTGPYKPENRVVKPPREFNPPPGPPSPKDVPVQKKYEPAPNRPKPQPREGHPVPPADIDHRPIKEPPGVKPPPPSPMPPQDFKPPMRPMG